MKYDYAMVIDGIIDEIIGREFAGKAAREQAEKRRIRARLRRKKTVIFVWSALYWLGVIGFIAGSALAVTNNADNNLGVFLLFVPFCITGGTIGLIKGVAGFIIGMIVGLVSGYILLLNFLNIGLAIEVILMLIFFSIIYSINYKSLNLYDKLAGSITAVVIIMGIGISLMYANRGSFGELGSYIAAVTGKEIFSVPEGAYTLDVTSANGAAKIFEVRYESGETVICLIRTTGSHRAISIASPGDANSFYVKDAESGKIRPLKEARLQDYDAAAGVELVFDPFKYRDFDLIEGNDTSESAWHFRNVKVREDEAE
jgi:hypothetical protein